MHSKQRKYAITTKLKILCNEHLGTNIYNLYWSSLLGKSAVYQILLSFSVQAGTFKIFVPTTFGDAVLT